MADWVTISALASAGGTLVLAGVTLGSVRSANRAARVAEQSLLAAQRPLLVQSRVDDPLQKVGFSDDVWLVARWRPGRLRRANDDAVYFAIAVRNVGTGIAVLHGWHLFPEIQLGAADMTPHSDRGLHHAHARPLHRARRRGVLAGRLPRPVESGGYREARRAVEAPQRMTVDILYGDFEGGQRVISRFLLTPRETAEELRWFASVGRHWNVDRPQPRER